MLKKDTNVAKDKFWLYAFRDHFANLRAYSNCIETADLNGDGDYKLIIADGSKKMKVYAGVSLSSETQLISVPSAVVCFYMGTGDGCHQPVVAVAVGSSIFMYRDNKPLYWFSLPLVAINEEEANIWAAVQKGEELSADEAVRKLDRLMEQGVPVSNRTLDLLLLGNDSERLNFVDRVRDIPLRQQDVTTCMTSIPLDRAEEGSSGCLVLGTENRLLYVLGITSMEVSSSVSLPSVPVFLIATGTYRGEYRLIVSCRDGRVYSVKNGILQTAVIHPDAQPVAIARYENYIAIITAANTLVYYNLKGKRHEGVVLPLPPTNLATITDPITGRAQAVVVALNNGEMRVYQGASLRHVSQVYGTVTGMKYCRYGREDSALVVVLQNGSLHVKLLHRKALRSEGVSVEHTRAQEKAGVIPLPHLSSVFVSQTAREKKHGVHIYRAFQYDWCHLRLTTARSYLSMISKAESALTSSIAMGAATKHRSVLLTVSIHGLGPIFKIKLTLQNAGEEPLDNLTVVFTFPADHCRMDTPLLRVPFLSYDMVHSLEALIELLGGITGGEDVVVSVFDKCGGRSLAKAVVQLPEIDVGGDL